MSTELRTDRVAKAVSALTQLQLDHERFALLMVGRLDAALLALKRMKSDLQRHARRTDAKLAVVATALRRAQL